MPLAFRHYKVPAEPGFIMEVWGNKTQSYDRVVTWHGSLTPEAVKQIRRTLCGSQYVSEHNIIVTIAFLVIIVVTLLASYVPDSRLYREYSHQGSN